MKRKILIIAISGIAPVVIVGGMVLVAVNRQRHEPTKSGDTGITLGPLPSVPAADEQEAKVQSGFEPITLQGTGQQATKKFQLNAGGYRFSLTHDGERNFSAWLTDDQGNNVDLLANKIGETNVSKVVNVPRGTYLVNVGADGNWTIKIDRP
ncbi:hypothetical protein ACFY3G_18325 [Streptomyces phaeochromogenes]|uniref:hypothetical protein n=1 Tax=Streptomyces phaeochromogenes TaxID=1923 RepID=UPI0036A16CC0